MSGSGISWAICKSAPCCRQITMPATHHSVFYTPDIIPATKPTDSKHWRLTPITTWQLSLSWHRRRQWRWCAKQHKCHVNDGCGADRRQDDEFTANRCLLAVAEHHVTAHRSHVGPDLSTKLHPPHVTCLRLVCQSSTRAPPTKSQSFHTNEAPPTTCQSFTHTNKVLLTTRHTTPAHLSIIHTLLQSSALHMLWASSSSVNHYCHTTNYELHHWFGGYAVKWCWSLSNDQCVTWPCIIIMIRDVH